MTIFTQDNIRRGRYLEEFQSPLSDYLGTSFEEGLYYNPIPSLNRLAELTAAEHGVPSFPGDLSRVETGGYVAGSGPDSPNVDAATARQRIKDEGLDLTVPDAGIRQRAL